MSDAQLFAAVVVAIYLSDCVFWASQSAVGFVRWTGAAMRLVYPTSLLANERGGFLAVTPLPPLGDHFVAHPWPVSATADHVCSYTAHGLHPDGRPRQESVGLKIDEVGKVETDGRKVLVNGVLFFRADSHALARAVARFVSALSKVPAQKRESFIRRHLRSTLDVKEVAHRVAEYRQVTRWIRVMANALFLVMVVMVPVLLWLHWASLHWITLLGVALLIQWIILALYHRAHRRLFPDEPEDRWQHLAFLFFAPPAAIRAHDALARRLLVAFHPLAVAQVLCEGAVAREFAGRTWRDLQQPRLPVCGSDNPALAATEAAARDMLTDEMRLFFQRQKMDVASLENPPMRDPQCASYCPRCHQQYTVAEGMCGECGGVLLRRFSL